MFFTSGAVEGMGTFGEFVGVLAFDVEFFPVLGVADLEDFGEDGLFEGFDV